MRAPLWLLVVGPLCFGCAPEGATVTVRVVSGLRAGDDIAVLDVVLSPGASCSRSGTSHSRDLSSSDQDALAVGSLAVPAFTHVASGVHSILVTARRRSGGLLTDVLSRCVVVSVSNDRVVRVPLSVSCVGVACPSPDGSAEHTECLNGRCVAPRCAPDDDATRELCCDRALLGDACDERPTACAADVECPRTLPCSLAPTCVAGVCVEPPGDTCAEGEFCDATERRCVPRDGVRRDAGAPDAALELDATADAGRSVAREDCVRIGDEDGDGSADCTDTDCMGRAICVAPCAPRAATPMPVERIPTPTHWYRADASIVRTPSGDVCALEDLVGGAPLLADPTTMPTSSAVGDLAANVAIELDRDAWLVASGTYLGVDRDGDYAMFVVIQDTDDPDAHQPFTAGTLEGTAFDVITLRLHHELEAPWERSVVAHGTVLAAGAGSDNIPHSVGVLAAATPAGADIVTRLDYRFDDEPSALVGSGVIPSRVGTGVPSVRVGPALLAGRFLLAELITYDRCLGGPEAAQVRDYLRERYRSPL